MDLAMMRGSQRRVSEQKKPNNHDVELLYEFMNWLQENKHINKSEEYRKELCDSFLRAKESENKEREKLKSLHRLYARGAKRCLRQNMLFIAHNV